jgi:hypothetical protein
MDTKKLDSYSWVCCLALVVFTIPSSVSLLGFLKVADLYFSV